MNSAASMDETDDVSGIVSWRPRPLASCRVLLVEDDEAIREALCEVLLLVGFTVEVARDGQEALERLERGPAPDVVVLDFMMPRMDGVELRRRVRAHDRLCALPLVVMTACGDELLERDPMALDPCTRLIAKPFELETILSAIAEVAPRALPDELAAGA